MVAGCAKVFREKMSGARSDRPELAKAISKLASGRDPSTSGTAQGAHGTLSASSVLQAAPKHLARAALAGAAGRRHEFQWPVRGDFLGPPHSSY